MRIKAKKTALMFALALMAALAAAGSALAMHDITFGTDGPDRLVGTDRADDMRGEGGRDLVRALAGGDTVYGGGDEDRIHGGRGEDFLIGWDWRNLNERIPASDRIKGGPGDDLLRGGSGADFLGGGRGNDTLRGGRGDDVLRVGESSPERDRIFCGPGNDTVIGIKFTLDTAGPGCETFVE